jgi:hydroxyethylthiazole kinase-like uncharacterized protein yjeF
MSGARPVSLESLSEFPLPHLSEEDDKEARGRVLVVAGGARVPGASLLTGIAALRAGAGKLQLAAPVDHCLALGLAMPEAAILAVAVTPAGEMTVEAGDTLSEAASQSQVVVAGPGMVDEETAGALARRLLACAGDAAFVLDAAAMTGLDLRSPCQRRLVLTPHAGEMAKILDIGKGDVLADPLAAARQLARRAGAIVVMKGAESFIVSPDGKAWRHGGGGVGLATSGSGDVLAGLIAGLLARGATPLAAAVWGVCVHAGAGARLSRRFGQVGFLARELLDEAPAVIAQASQAKAKGSTVTS